MKCFLVEKDGQGHVKRRVVRLSRDRLPAGEVLIRVSHSSLNYKDALAASGHPGVVRQLPHVPGIDAAGVVERSETSDYAAGDQVLVTGYALGGAHWGGWSEYIQVPSDWVVPLPKALSAVEAMTLGTAGFTAAQCVQSLQNHGVQPDSEQGVVVTGATGGVGSLAVMLLSQLGYRVTALTCKESKH